MSITDLGVFAPYQPNPYPEFFPPGAAFWRNEEGEDFYKLRNSLVTLEPNTGGFIEAVAEYFALVGPDGLVMHVTGDPSTLANPDGFRFIYSDELIQFGMLYENGALSVPPPPPPPPITLTSDVLFFDRMTDAEYDALDASVRDGESARVYRSFNQAAVFVEGTDMWALLDKHMSLVVDSHRKQQLLER